VGTVDDLEEMISPHADAGILTVSALLVIVPSILYMFHVLTFAQFVASIGIIAFIIPIILGFSERFSLASRFGNGEVRKAIVISLTIIYIALLSTYFFEVTLPLSKGMLNNTSHMENIFNITKTAGLNKTIAGGNWSITQINQIPTEALRDITTNFLWVYAVIIIFYFGSRAWESVAETNMIKELKDVSPLELAKRRYILGSISSQDYKAIQGAINEQGLTLVDIKHKDKDNYILFIRNYGSGDLNIDSVSINDNVQNIQPVKIPGGKYDNIDVSISGIEPKNGEYKFEITFTSDGITKTSSSSIKVKK